MLKISQSNEAGNSSSSPDLLMQLERVKIEQEKIGKEREKAMRALEQERKRIEKKP